MPPHERMWLLAARALRYLLHKKKWKPIYTVYEPTYVVLYGRKCKFMWFYAVYAKRPHIYSHWSLSSPQGQCLGNTAHYVLEKYHPRRVISKHTIKQWTHFEKCPTIFKVLYKKCLAYVRHKRGLMMQVLVLCVSLYIVIFQWEQFSQ